MHKLGVLLLCAAALGVSAPLTPAWVAVGEGGRSTVRIIVAAPTECPAIVVDGATIPMVLRQPVPQGFSPACEFQLPANAKAASVNGQVLKLPKADPSRIAVFGDTGCRIEGGRLQDCNHPDKWPFAQVSAAASAAQADLVIHVGDYLYREAPCPAGQEAQCGGTPSGDNWAAWNADFFTPAAKLLASTPWIFARGNHENCARSWRGWFYYLELGPWKGVCEASPPPVTIKLGAFEVVLFDSGSASDKELNTSLSAAYAKELKGLNVNHAWLVDHHPLWGLKADVPGKPPVPIQTELNDAWDKAAPAGIDMILSGHTHLFEILSFADKRPVQLVAGTGGTQLAVAIPEHLSGATVQGLTLAAGESEPVFGFTLFTRTAKGWTAVLKGPEDRSLVTCDIEGRTAHCK